MFHFGIGSRSWMEEILDSNSVDTRPASLMRVNKTRFLRERQEYQVMITGVDMTVIVPNHSKCAEMASAINLMSPWRTICVQKIPVYTTKPDEMIRNAPWNRNRLSLSSSINQ